MAASSLTTPLYRAAESGDVDQVRELLQHGKYAVNCTDSKGRTPLHYASAKGCLAVVEVLMLEFRADQTIQDADGCTAVMLAALGGHSDVANVLLSQPECPVNVTESKNNTVLHYACFLSDISLARTLIREYKADVNARNLANDTPLHLAAYTGNVEVTVSLIKEFGCDSTLTGSNGESLLHKACRGGNVTLVRTLIREYKADINARNFWKDTPLHVASGTGKAEVALSLINEFGCDPTLTGYNGMSLLHKACQGGNVNLVQTLIREHKANVSALDKKGDTPLHVAAYNGKANVALLLINEFGCDPTLKGSLGRSLLHRACEGGRVNLVDYLLHFVSPSVTDIYGFTPLYYAFKYDHLECVHVLLDADKYLHTRSDIGESRVGVAFGRTIAFLDSYSGDNSKIGADYNTFLKHAEKKYSGSHHITRVFVLGNPGAGKSSLIESLKRESFLQTFWKVSESAVPPHTAGIIPSIHLSRLYGRVMFYDFAGDIEYYSSHAAIFENLASSRKGDDIFIIVIDLRQDKVTFRASLHYWLSFIQHQKFKKPLYIVVGSHYDLPSKSLGITSEWFNSLEVSFRSQSHRIQYFALDCRDPRSNEIGRFKDQLFTWIGTFDKYEISTIASLLLGLLEKDFSTVTACPLQTLATHIKESGVWLPVEVRALYPYIMELHEVGLLLALGDCTEGNCHVILQISKLTNEVHQLLFSKSAISDMQKKYSCLTASPFDIGIIPENILTEILPPYITSEHLVHLQYCQRIKHTDIGVFPSLDQEDSTKSFLFFPALCSVDKSQVSWSESTDNDFSIGWLVLCTDIHDYFPPRFLHVLLLRLVFGFALSVPDQLQTAHASPEYSRRCTMWKRGVHWLMAEGVECMVELVSESKVNKGVVVLTKSPKEWEENCITVFTKIIHCVMEAKAEFCHSLKPQFFLLDCTTGNYLHQDNMFAMSDVEKAIVFHQEKVIISISGKGSMNFSKLLCMRKLTHWNSIFPIDFSTVNHLLRDIVKELNELGEALGASRGVLQGIEADFPFDVNRRRRKLVSWWMSSSPDPPCWWHLVQALKRIEYNALAEKLRKKHEIHIHLQEKMLAEANQAVKPDEEFLQSLSVEVGSRWPSLAVSLSLSEGEIAGLKEKVGLTQQDLALQMLMIWASREEATYGQLYCKLRTISVNLIMQ